MFFGDRQVSAVYYGDRFVTSVYYGDRSAWNPNPEAPLRTGQIELTRNAATLSLSGILASSDIELSRKTTTFRISAAKLIAGDIILTRNEFSYMLRPLLHGGEVIHLIRNSGTFALTSGPSAYSTAFSSAFGA